MRCSEMNKNQWIPTSTGVLPKEGITVQVTYLGYHTNEPMCDGFAYRSNGEWYWNMWGDDEYDLVNVPIIAWRYCQPYKEEPAKAVREITPEQLLHIHNDFNTLVELSQYIHYLEDVKRDYDTLKANVRNLANMAEELY